MIQPQIYLDKEMIYFEDTTPEDVQITVENRPENTTISVESTDTSVFTVSLNNDVATVQPVATGNGVLVVSLIDNETQEVLTTANCAVFGEIVHDELNIVYSTMASYPMPLYYIANNVTRCISAFSVVDSNLNMLSTDDGVEFVSNVIKDYNGNITHTFTACQQNVQKTMWQLVSTQEATLKEDFANMTAEQIQECTVTSTIRYNGEEYSKTEHFNYVDTRS